MTKWKETDIGKVPEAWELKKWGELASLEYGKALYNYSDSVDKYPVYGTNGQIGWCNRFLYSNEGIIIGRKGAYRGVHYSAKPFFVIDTAYYLNPKINFDMKWAYYELLTHDINSLDSGSAIPSTARKDFYNLDVVCPPINEQRAIAKILSDLDAKIELNRQMNATLEKMAEALFKHWFIDFEFPNEQGKPYKSNNGKMVESELGEIPEGWEAKHIDEIADFLNGLALQKFPAKDKDNYLPVIKIRELKQGITESSDKADIDLPPDYIVNDGDVLFSWSGSLEATIWCGGIGALNQHLFKVTSPTYPKWFYYHWVLRHLPEYRRIAEGKATTLGHIQRHHLKSSLVLVPDSKTLSKMDMILGTMIDKIIILKIESKNLSQIRDSLLPKLMFGKIRVVEVVS